MNGALSPAEMQRTARLVGALYVLTNISGFTAYSLRLDLMRTEGWDRVARAAGEAEATLRLVLALEIATVAAVMVLVAGSYRLLAPTGPLTALVSLLWRVVEHAVLAVSALNAGALIAASKAGGAAGAGLAGVHLRLYSNGFSAGFVLLGLGTAGFCWLWLRSGLVPRWMALFGLAAAVVMSAGALTQLAAPALMRGLNLPSMIPLGLFEVGFGLWLAIRGLRPAEKAAI